tara:strand:- start:534 stop:647 length:114 start_codon:yes stop_codon:yes gene_type:complete
MNNKKRIAERLEMEWVLIELIELALIANVGIEGVDFN